MYVNAWTEGLGERGKRAVALLLERGVAAGLVPPAPLDWATAAKYRHGDNPADRGRPSDHQRGRTARPDGCGVS